jgi:hypothetical protein
MGSAVRPVPVTPDDEEFQAWRAKGGARASASATSLSTPDEQEFQEWKRHRADGPGITVGEDARPIRMPPVVVTAQRPRVLAPPAMATRDATQLARVANPQATKLTGAPKVASDILQGAAAPFEHPAETIVGGAAAPVEAAAKAGLFLGQRVNAATDPDATDVGAAMGVPRVSDAEALHAAAQLAAIGLGKYARILVGKTLAPAVGSRVAGAVGSAAEGAGVGAAYDPEHPARGAAIGGVLGGAINEADPYRPRVRRPVTLEPGAELDAARLLPRRPAPSAEARVVDRPPSEPPGTAAAEPDYTVEDSSPPAARPADEAASVPATEHAPEPAPVPDEEEFAAWQREHRGERGPSVAAADAAPLERVSDWSATHGERRSVRRAREVLLLDAPITAETTPAQVQARLEVYDRLAGDADPAIAARAREAAATARTHLEQRADPVLARESDTPSPAESTIASPAESPAAAAMLQDTGAAPRSARAGAPSATSSTAAPPGAPAAATPAAAPPATPAATPAAAAPAVNRYAAATRAVFAPTTLSPEAGTMGRIVRAQTGLSARQLEQARAAMRGFARTFDRMKPDERLDVIDRVERGAPQATPELEQAASQFRRWLDDTRDEVRALGTGKLEAWIQHYFPHIWKDPAAAERVVGTILGKRPLEGPKSFLKKRTIPTTKEGIAAGLEPVTDNPVDLVLLKLREMRRYIAAHRILQEAEGQGLAKYVDATAQGPDGWRRIDDRIGTVFGKPSVEATEAFDREVRQGLEAAIARLKGLKHARKPSTGMRGALGFARGADEMVTKFGTDDGVMIHELGHILDARYGLWEALTNTAQLPGTTKAARAATRATVQRELRALADLRNAGGGQLSKTYLHNRYEKIANAIHALVHAPARMAEVAPTTKQLLTEFLSSKPELKPILDITPGVAIGTATTELPVHGLVVRGHYWAPEDVSRVLNNYLSPGLRGNALYDAYQGINNVLNSVQLGLSAFHVGFTSMDAAVSQAAVGLQHLTHGRIRKGLTQLATYPAAPITTLWRGSKVLKAYWHPEGQPSELLQIVDAIAAAGGRVRQDPFYKTDAPKHFLEALRHGKALTAGRLALPAVLEAAAKPVMEWVVPRQKLGVFAQLAERALADLPAEASRDDVRRAMQRAWDSVDNRLGQLVYDTLFWNKTLKDLAMASVRSVGWNLGTVRELGGGAIDLGKAAAGAARGERPELTERASYVLALPFIVGLTGGIMGYLLTGERPKELKDYFYPRTGRKNAEGNDERVQLPSYMKDVMAYKEHPVQTLEHKQAPLGAMLSDMLHNEDFYGDQIRNADDPLVTQLAQEARFLAQQFVPLGVRNAEEAGKRVADPRMQVAGFAGVTAAPRTATRTAAENKMMELLGTKAPRGATPEQKATRERVGALATAARQGTLADATLDAAEDAGSVSQRQVARIRTAAEGERDVWLERFQRLNADEALAVYTLASAAERAQWRDALELKLIKAGREDELDALEPVHVSTTSSTTSSTASTESRATSRPPPRVRVPR